MFVFVDNQKIEIEDNSTGIDLAKKLNLTSPKDAIAIIINEKPLDLSVKLNNNDKIRFLSFEEKEGKKIFWHSSAHILAQAVLRLFPEAKPTIGPAIDYGFYYDFANLKIVEEDLLKIENEVKNIIEESLKPKRIEYKNKQEALKAFENNPYKIELIREFDDPNITAYQQGEFYDLCRGPHLPFFNKIKAFKVTKTSGAYWRGNSSNEMLTRIYGVSFPNKTLLQEYLTLLEESKKRDHKILGQKLSLFGLKEEAPGMPFIYPSGMYIWQELLKFLRECLSEKKYIEIKTPVLMTKELWETSGHWFHYRENMYTSVVENREFAIKPMNCPGGMLYYKTYSHSYKELPLKVAEIGNVHRHEPSGALNGLFRVRSFHQDDAHVFMTPNQIKDQILETIELADKIYMTFGLSYKMELSTRPEKSKTIGSDQEWENATNGLKSALDEYGHSYKINEGDGAFYGPKIDFHIFDALNRSWQCGTIQLDMSLPEKFDLHYIDSDGYQKRPVMIHRALFGSIERFFGILIEHFAGNFPLWISPKAVRIIPVADRHVAYANTLKDEIYKKTNLPVDVDSSNESVSKKIRNAQLLKINYMLTVGDAEVENNTLNLRTRDNARHGEIQINNFLEKVSYEKNTKALISPFAAS
ncbi:MAG: threonine--tRNA ligase [Chlamydiae bacterium RIFCSPHIGHO2_12_FULL_27_8]|nr:MAG: threonine--tRNA ligase [Chlamydiae bacterium RIFCSPHIGHO2_12_FULL_27_8]